MGRLEGAGVAALSALTGLRAGRGDRVRPRPRSFCMRLLRFVLAFAHRETRSNQNERDA